MLMLYIIRRREFLARKGVNGQSLRFYFVRFEIHSRLKRRSTCLWTPPILATNIRIGICSSWRKKMMVVLLPLLPPNNKSLLQNQNSCQATRHPAPDPAQLTINQQHPKIKDHLPTKTDEDLCSKEEQTCIPTIKKRVLKPTASNSAPA